MKELLSIVLWTLPKAETVHDISKPELGPFCVELPRIEISRRTEGAYALVTNGGV